MIATEAQIMLIVMIVVAVGGVTFMFNYVEEVKEHLPEEHHNPELRFVQVITENITNQTVKHIRISFTTDRPIKLNNTLITLQTESDVAYLQYRNGTLTRNLTSGFYTQ